MIVVDTNILVYRWAAGPQRTAIEQLLRLDPIWTAPPLWRSEYRNVLARNIRQAAMTVGSAEKAIRLAADCLLGGERPVPDEIVFNLIAQSSCPAYDCEFAGLALLLGTVLITADLALLRAFPRFCFSLEHTAWRGHGSP